MIAAEAGARWSYEGQLMIAQVMVNRVHSGHWGNSMYSVLSAPRQFTPWTTGVWKTRVPSQLQYRAGADALNGAQILPADTLYFCTDYAYWASSWFQSLEVVAVFENVYFMR